MNALPSACLATYTTYPLYVEQYTRPCSAHWIMYIDTDTDTAFQHIRWSLISGCETLVFDLQSTVFSRAVPAGVPGADTDQPSVIRVVCSLSCSLDVLKTEKVVCL